MRLRAPWLLSCAISLFPISVSAQTQLCTPAPPATAFTCYAGLTFHTAFDFPAGTLAGDVFKIRIDGAQVGPDIPAPVGTTTMSIAMTGYPVSGPHPVTVGITRAPLAEVVSSVVTVSFIAVPPPIPPAPGNLRIVAELLDTAGKVLARYVLLDVPPSVGP